MVTNASGQFNLSLSRGIYALFVAAPGYLFLYANLTVWSPIAGIVYVLNPVPTFPLSGTVVDGWSGNGIGGVSIYLSEFAPSFVFVAATHTGADGRFHLSVPNGTLALLVLPPAGYANLSVSVNVAGAPVSGYQIRLPPTQTGLATEDPYTLVLISIPIIFGIGATARWLDARERRVQMGLPPRVFSPTARYIALRGALIPFQLIATLFVLYIFGVYLPAIALATLDRWTLLRAERGL